MTFMEALKLYDGSSMARVIAPLSGKVIATLTVNEHGSSVVRMTEPTKVENLLQFAYWDLVYDPRWSRARVLEALSHLEPECTRLGGIYIDAWNSSDWDLLEGTLEEMRKAFGLRPFRVGKKDEIDCKEDPE